MKDYEEELAENLNTLDEQEALNTMNKDELTTLMHLLEKYDVENEHEDLINEIQGLLH